MIITIDGPAGSGKGTIAAALAEKYKMAYFDTGMVYRAVGLQMVLNKDDLANADKATQIAKELTFPKMMELAKNKDFRSDVGSQAASIRMYARHCFPCKKTLRPIPYFLTELLPTAPFMMVVTQEQLFVRKPI